MTLLAMITVIDTLEYIVLKLSLEFFFIGAFFRYKVGKFVLMCITLSRTKLRTDLGMQVVLVRYLTI